jgi:hypothetical protein
VRPRPAFGKASQKDQQNHEGPQEVEKFAPRAPDYGLPTLDSATLDTLARTSGSRWFACFDDGERNDASQVFFVPTGFPMRKVLVFGAAISLIAGSLTASKFAFAADSPAPGQIPPARLLDGPASGKAALAAANARGVLAQVAAQAGKTEAQITALLSTDESANVNIYGATYFVEPAYDPVAKAAAAAQPAPATAPQAPNKPAPPLQVLDEEALAAANDVAAKAIAETTSPNASPGAGPAPATATVPVRTAQGPFPYTDTFTLHSRPGATKVIYLDFDGYTTTSSSGWGPFVGVAFNTDGTAGFSTSEQDAIQSIWQRVAEDYAVFNVDVTTQDPGFAAIDRADAADQNYGTTVAIVGNPNTLPLCGGCGGVAFLGKFDTTSSHSFYQPAWVFQTNLSSEPKFMAEASSHESGHMLGLSHDGCSSAGVGTCTANDLTYYGGHANWAPIMGNSYYRPVTQWSFGEYLGANNPESDLSLIAAKIAYAADETNDSFATASSLGGIGVGPQSGSGVISSTSDFDYFKFFSPTAGTVQVDVSTGGQPGSVSPNLDARLQYFAALSAPASQQSDPTSAFVNFDTASGMGASLTINLANPGFHYFIIDNASTDLSGDSGYSYYGSIGGYTVTVTPITPSGDTFLPVPDTRLLDTRPTAITAGSTIDVQVAGGLSPVPADATAVVLNVAAVAPPTSGHIRVYPTGVPLPNASVLNFTAGKNTPNQVIVKVGTGGNVTLYAGGTTNMIVDVSGYFAADTTFGSSPYVPIEAPFATTISTITIPALETSDVQVRGTGGMPGINGPGIVTKVALNVAVLNPTSTGHIRVFPAGAVIPPTSTNNFVSGDSRTNLVVTAWGNNGQVSIYNTTTAPVTVRVDTVGYFGSSGLGFRSIDPVRPLDTRNLVNGLPNIVAGGDFREVEIRGFGPVPNSPDVKAVVVNVAAVNPTLPGTFSGGPSGVVTTLEALIHPANENVANLMILPVGTDGKIRIANNMAIGGTSHMIVDITGYFTN